MPRILAALFIAAALPAVSPAADWPQWRGPDRSGNSKDTGLLQSWPESGPAIRWKITDLGTGYSSPVVVGGRVYIQTTRGADEFAVALDEKTGSKLWETPIGKVGPNMGPQYPGTRATVTVDGDRLYCLASDGELNCLTADGKVLWHKNLARDLNGQVGNWAYTESVLIDGDKLICTPGGTEATLAALNKATGDVIWKAAVPGGDIADYASVMPVEGGRKQYVQYMRKALVGVDAETGKFLWKDSRTQDQGASMLTPVVQGNKVFISGGRSAGTLLDLTASGDGVEAKSVYLERAITPGIGGAVLIDGHLYGTTATELFCADFATGKVKWKERAVGAGSVCAADGRLYVRGHATGDTILVDPTPEGFKEVGRLKQPNRSKTPAWPHPVVANGGLYLRDMDALVVFDVKK